LPAIDVIPKIETAARKALELDATLAEPHAALGMSKSRLQWDWEGGGKEFKQAIELNPNSPTAHHWYSISLREQGKFEEALAEITRAQELDPLSLIINANVAEVLYYMRRDDLAMEQFTRTVELDPIFAQAHKSVAWMYARQGKYDEAIIELQTIRQIVGANNPFGMGDLGYVYARAGKKEEAIKVLNQLLEFSKQKYTLSVQIAGIYAGLGEKDKAFEWLWKGYDEHNYSLGDLRISFVFENLRSDSRYTALLKKIGLEK
jgi:tetratricopeptide (TPR) repeat protein